jgi:hypothetical protein
MSPREATGRPFVGHAGGDLQNVQHKDGAYTHVVHALRLSALGPVKGTQLDTVDGGVRFSALISVAGDGKPDAIVVRPLGCHI